MPQDFQQQPSRFMQKFALLSVSDKTDLPSFAQALVEKHGYTLLSTGGTAKLLREKKIPVTDVSEHTQSPEIMEGRVKTLHSKIHGGILCRRDSQEHLAEAESHNIALIDLVVVNLYPFERVTANPDCAFDDAIENIDIGGPSMLRSAAKNHAAVAVVTDPVDYQRVLSALDSPETLPALRRELALKAFQRTAAYDAAIASYLENLASPAVFPSRFSLQLPLAQPLRYGENPHQQAALYGDFHKFFHQLQGKELSYNNILDITAADALIREFQKPSLAILKHTNPCGVASAPTLLEAWQLAFETDKQAPFGGIIIANRPIDRSLASAIAEIFSEVIIAPEFTNEALELFSKKKNLRLMRSSPDQTSPHKRRDVALRSVIGGILLQDADTRPIDPSAFKVVTQRQPSPAEWDSLLFGWRVVKHVKSNAIVYAANERTLGIGAGQMSRVDSSRLAAWKANEAHLSLENAIVASDAFFPFADGLLAAAGAGATAAIQPGGSVRDPEVIAAANARNMAMVFTNTRHFRH
ncbi:MAG: bifunctional phosphoribosylaminoimidazolecarboxamide formyltransferase/IMP cyclohydrolase [Puniceicoccales bacterium]|nr:bifunctional phosphoribosylaminoimidazolecarboxamide formyltransferase/IMP cyclohydrolase [Puniceicoccales bacterium]